MYASENNDKSKEIREESKAFLLIITNSQSYFVL